MIFCRSCHDGSHFRGLSNLLSVLMPFPDRDAKSGIALPWSKRAQTYSQTQMSHKSITFLLAASKGGTQEPLSSSESSLHWRDVPWAGRGSSRATSAHLCHATGQHLPASPWHGARAGSAVFHHRLPVVSSWPHISARNTIKKPNSTTHSTHSDFCPSEQE